MVDQPPGLKVAINKEEGKGGPREKVYKGAAVIPMGKKDPPRKPWGVITNVVQTKH